MSFDVQKILQDAGEWLLSSGLRIFLILILALVAVKACKIGAIFIKFGLAPTMQANLLFGLISIMDSTVLGCELRKFPVE